MSKNSAFDYSYLEECIRQQIVMVIEDWPQANDTALRAYVKGLGSAEGYDQAIDPRVKRRLNETYANIRNLVDELKPSIEPLRCELEVTK